MAAYDLIGEGGVSDHLHFGAKDRAQFVLDPKVIEAERPAELH